MKHLLQSIQHMLQSISGDTTIGKILIAGGAILTSYFTPIVGLLLACFLCSIIDMVYGIKVAKMLKKKITSRKNWKGTLLKIKDESVLILLTHLIEYTIFGAGTACVLSGGVTIIIALTEVWSILENLNTLNPNGPWRSLGKFLKKKGEDYIGFEIDLNDNSNSKPYDNNNSVVAEEL